MPVHRVFSQRELIVNSQSSAGCTRVPTYGTILRGSRALDVRASVPHASYPALTDDLRTLLESDLSDRT